MAYLDAVLAAAYTLVASLVSGAGCGARTALAITDFCDNDN